VIYLDCAATTLQKPPCVAAAVARAIGTLGNSGRGVYAGSLDASRLIYGTREKLAALFHCPRADHVAFAPNSTAALNLAIASLGPGGHVLSTDCEHNSVLRPLYRLREQGTAVSFLPADKKGRIDYDDFERLLRPDTRAVVCTHASNLTGNMLDLEKIGAFAEKHALRFIVDASQTAGVFPIDMEAMRIGVLCFTGHKSLLGPQGTGGLAARDGEWLRPWNVGGTGVQSWLERQPDDWPTRLEAGTLNAHGLAGLSAALDFLSDTGLDKIRERETALAARFYAAVREIPGVTVYGDFDAPVRAPIVSLNVRDYDSGEIADALAERCGIAVRPGAHCAPRLHRALGTEKRGAVRFSFGYYNTEAEADAAAAAIKELAKP
jgi:cysteine desulfurase family protein